MQSINNAGVGGGVFITRITRQYSLLTRLDLNKICLRKPFVQYNNALIVCTINPMGCDCDKNYIALPGLHIKPYHRSYSG